jgi:peptide/nickel transport system permease protein
VRRQVAALGGAIIPYVVPRLGDLDEEARKAVLDGLDKVAVRMKIVEDVGGVENRERFWHEYWDYYRMDYRPARARRLVLRYVRERDELALKEIVRLNTYCLPAIFEVLDQEGLDGQTLPLLALLPVLTGIERPGGPGVAPEINRASLRAWKDWWWHQEDQYTTCNALCRATGLVTQTQYAKWLRRIVTFDFGESTTDGRPVTAKLAERLPVTLLLSVLALLAAYVVAIPVGSYSALYPSTLSDRAITFVLFVLYSLPSFWLALMLIRLLCGVGGLDLFPLRGLASAGSEQWPLHARLLDLVHHLVLPVFCLSYVSFATLSRYQRSGMMEVVRQDYIRTARAKGLRETSVIVRHALRNSVIPILTLLGLQIPYLIGGSVIIERVFAIEGMGLETFEAIRNRDYNWILAVSVLTALLTLLGILLSDVMYAVVDPRITYEKRRT